MSNALTENTYLHFSPQHLQMIKSDPVNQMLGATNPSLYLTTDGKVVPATLTSSDQGFPQIKGNFNDYGMVGHGRTRLTTPDGQLTSEGRHYAAREGIESSYYGILSKVDISHVADMANAGTASPLIPQTFYE